jgi:heme-degrading monooxygenase HmoA
VRQTGLTEYAETPGYRGVRVLQRTRDGLTKLTVISFWDSIEAIKAFAGDDPEVAHYYPEDDEYLVEREAKVEHHEVVELG